jgi:hypothetical protein
MKDESKPRISSFTAENAENAAEEFRQDYRDASGKQGQKMPIL